MLSFNIIKFKDQKEKCIDLFVYAQNIKII